MSFRGDGEGGVPTFIMFNIVCSFGFRISVVVLSIQNDRRLRFGLKGSNLVPWGPSDLTSVMSFLKFSFLNLKSVKTLHRRRIRCH